MIREKIGKVRNIFEIAYSSKESTELTLSKLSDLGFDSSLVEHSIRSKLQDYIFLQSERREKIQHLIRICLSSKNDGCFSYHFPFLLLQDLFNSSSSCECDHYFHFFFVDGVDVILKFLSFARKNKGGKKINLRILLICNTLLKESNDPFLRYKVLLFVSAVIPVFDRSGLNYAMNFQTLQTKEIFVNIDPEKEMNDDEDKKSEDNFSISPPTPSSSFSLFKQFWDLQEYINDFSLFTNTNKCNRFLQTIEMIFQKFEVKKMNRSSFTNDTTNIESFDISSHLSNETFFEQQCFSEYFQMTILIQIIIACHRMLHTKIKSKKRGDELEEVNEVQKKHIEEWMKKCYHHLKQESNDNEKEEIILKDIRKHFLERLQMLLNREIDWIDWKQGDGSLKTRCKGNFFNSSSSIHPPPSSSSFLMNQTPEGIIKMDKFNRSLRMLWDVESNLQDSLVSKDGKQFIKNSVFGGDYEKFRALKENEQKRRKKKKEQNSSSSTKKTTITKEELKLIKEETEELKKIETKSIRKIRSLDPSRKWVLMRFLGKRNLRKMGECREKSMNKVIKDYFFTSNCHNKTKDSLKRTKSTNQKVLQKKRETKTRRTRTSSSLKDDDDDVEFVDVGNGRNEKFYFPPIFIEQKKEKEKPIRSSKSKVTVSVSQSSEQKSSSSSKSRTKKKKTTTKKSHIFNFINDIVFFFNQKNKK